MRRSWDDTSAPQQGRGVAHVNQNQHWRFPWAILRRPSDWLEVKDEYVEPVDPAPRADPSDSSSSTMGANQMGNLKGRLRHDSSG